MAEIIVMIGRDTNEALNIIRDHYSDETKNFDENNLFQYVMDTVLLALLNHEHFQTKLNHLYAGDVDKRLFEFINYVNFTSEIARVNSQLGPNFFIPQVKSMEKNNFLRISSDFNTTHLIFSIHLPVLNTTFYELNEFIPIPIRDENSAFILDLKPTTFFQSKSKIYAIPKNEKNDLCVSQSNLTICNTRLEESIYSPSNCIQNQILFNSNEDCIYKQIEFKNYFIQLSCELVYAFVTKPIKLMKQCGDTREVLYLTESQVISLKTGCMLFKHYDDEQLKAPETTKSMYGPDSQLNIDFSKIPTRKPMPKLPIIDKYNIEQLEIINSLREVHSAIPLARERVDKIELKNPLDEFFGSWNLKEYFMWGLIWLIGIIFAIMNIYFCCQKINK